MDKEEQKIEEWMKNPIVPEWLKAHIKDPEAPNTLHYDEEMNKYVYTPVEGAELYFNSTAEAHDDSRVKRDNTDLIGDFPDLLPDRDFGQTTKTSRLLFFSTNNKDYKLFLYRVYLCQENEERYTQNPQSFITANGFIASHMLNWRVDDDPIRDYSFNTHSHISKKALITGQVHMWQAGTTVMEKSTMTEQEHFTTGATIEAAIVSLAAEIYDTYTWEGNFRK